MENAPNPQHAIINENLSQEAHEAVMSEMSGYNGAAFEPEVGIFWLDVERGELFDVVSIPAAQLPLNQNTIGKLHKDVWAKKYFRAKSKKETDSIYFTDYTQIPRGRVFIDKATNRFIVKVGNWIHDYEPMLTPLIREEFNLTEFTYESEHDFNLYAK